jgi:hypothetical protein
VIEEEGRALNTLTVCGEDVRGAHGDHVVDDLLRAMDALDSLYFADARTYTDALAEHNRHAWRLRGSLQQGGGELSISSINILNFQPSVIIARKPKNVKSICMLFVMCDRRDFSIIPRRVWLISRVQADPQNPMLSRCRDRCSLFGQSLGPPSLNSS